MTEQVFTTIVAGTSKQFLFFRVNVREELVDLTTINTDCTAQATSACFQRPSMHRQERHGPTLLEDRAGRDRMGSDPRLAQSLKALGESQSDGRHHRTK